MESWDKVKDWANELGYSVSAKNKSDQNNSEEFNYYWSNNNSTSKGMSTNLTKLISDIYRDKTNVLHQKKLNKRIE